MKKHSILIFFAILALNTSLAQKHINRVRFMPDMPTPFSIRDWKQAALDYDSLVFSFQGDGPFFPLNKWDDRQINYKGRSFSMISFVGDPAGDEGINCIAAVVAASLAGIDKSNQNGHNFVEMCRKWFSSDNGTNIYSNRLDADKNWNRLCDWYSSMPNILAFQLSDLYPQDKKLREQVLMCADFFIEAADRLEKEDKEGFHDPRRQRDFGAAIAWMEYMAYTITGKKGYLVAAEKGMKYVLNSKINPLYEMLLPYGAFIAGRMNAERGTLYNVDKLINWCFDGDALPRHGWGVIADRWDGYDMHGLQGSVTDGDGYAFAMNTFQMAGALTPLVRYDKGYAHDIGKWMLNLVNNTRMFYPDSYDKEHQSSYHWSKKYDEKSVIAYEGVRKWKRGWLTAKTDFKTVKGKVIDNDYRATRYMREVPVQLQKIKEIKTGNKFELEHIWEVELPADVRDRWLVMAAELVGPNNGNTAEILISDTPYGNYVKLFDFVNGTRERRSKYAAIPKDYKSLYVKVSTSNQNSSKPDTFEVDAIGVSYKTTISPFATGDYVAFFVDLINNSTVPIVAYLPEEAVTDLGLYGSSHVGILGGIVSTTDVEGILQLDLLKTDYFRPKAYPSYLYYNPYNEAKTITINTGDSSCDLYNTVTSGFVRKGVKGVATIEIPAKGASVIVFAPAGGKMTQSGKKKLVNGVVIDYGNIQ